jgi:hypothetical protein
MMRHGKEGIVFITIWVDDSLLVGDKDAKMLLPKPLTI